MKVTPEVEKCARALHADVWKRRGEPAPAFERDAEHYCAQALAAMEALLEILKRDDLSKYDPAVDLIRTAMGREG